MKNFLALALICSPFLVYAQNTNLPCTNNFENQDINNMTQFMNDSKNNNHTLQEYVNSLNFIGFKIDEENPSQIDKDNKLVGKTYLSSLFIKQFPTVKVRFLAKNSIVTMEYNNNRVNIMFDDFNTIVRITVG